MSLVTSIGTKRLVDPLHRLRAISRVLAAVTGTAMVVVALVVAGAWIIPAFTEVTLVPRLGRYREFFNDPSARFVTLAVILTLLGIFLFALDQARRLFAEFAAGEILTVRAAEKLQRISYAVITASIFRPVAHVALRSAFALDPAGGGRGLRMHWVLSLRDVLDNVAFLFAGLLLLAIAWALTEAARIADDYRQIV
jgi:hypothetical protein